MLPGGAQLVSSVSHRIRLVVYHMVYTIAPLISRGPVYNICHTCCPAPDNAEYGLFISCSSLWVSAPQLMVTPSVSLGVCCDMVCHRRESLTSGKTYSAGPLLPIDPPWYVYTYKRAPSSNVDLTSVMSQPHTSVNGVIVY